MNQNAEDWLPPGWTVKVKVRKNGKKDKFYIDPVNGNALRSIRDVQHYLTTGKLSQLAYKSRSQKNGGIEFQHDDISSPAVSKKEMLAIGKAKRQIIWSENSLEPSEVTNDEASIPNATSVGESMPFTEPNSGGIGTKLPCSTLPEAKDPEEQSDGKNDFSENGPIKNESGRQRKTEGVNLPRRASKRIAGLQAEPVLLEVKTGRRARPVACEESDKKVASTTTKWASQCPENPDVKHEPKTITDPPKADTSPDLARKEHICVDLPMLPKNVKKTKSEYAYEAEQQLKCKSILPLENILEKRLENEDKADIKQGPHLKQPVEDFLTDPCIAFAVNTLTGGVFDASISSEASLMPNNINCSSTALGPENKLNAKLPSPEQLPVTQGGKVGNDNVVEKLLSTLELSVGEILADPCIEFAIKTLTGEIPLDNNPDIEDYFHQLSTLKKKPRTN